MLSGLNTTGHEIGGSLGIAVLATIAAGASAAPAARPALAGGARRRVPRRRRHRRRRERCSRSSILPSARTFLPKLRLAPRVADPLTPDAPARTPRHPSPPRRRADAERSVARILDAAVDALASDPDASMAEIARRAGVVRATIYVHFPTREALLDAVTDRAIAEVARVIEAAEPDRGDAAPRRCARVVDGGVAHARALPRARRDQHPSCRHDELRRRTRSVLAPLEPLIERGQRDGSFRADVPAALAPLDAPRARPRRQRRAARRPPATRRVEAALVATVLGAVVANSARIV